MITNHMRVVVSFSHRQEGTVNYLDVEIYPYTDTGVVTRTTINLVDDADIDAMIGELEAVRDKLITSKHA